MARTEPAAILTRASTRQQAYFVGLLTFTSGCVDAVTLMSIGGSFTSVITGNLIFLGRAIGSASLVSALHAMMAVAGYIVGVAAGSRLIHVLNRPGQTSAPWPARATIVLAVEAAVLAAINIEWLVTHGQPAAAAGTDTMLVAAGIALGMQGAAARSIAGNPSTTYMTGALTSLVEALCTGQRKSVDASAVTGLATLVVGAAVSGALVIHVRSLALLPPLGAVLIVVAVKIHHHKNEQTERLQAHQGMALESHARAARP